MFVRLEDTRMRSKGEEGVWETRARFGPMKMHPWTRIGWCGSHNRFGGELASGFLPQRPEKVMLLLGDVLIGESEKSGEIRFIHRNEEQWKC